MNVLIPTTRRGVALAALLVLAAMAALSIVRPGHAASQSADIANFAFAPATLTVSVGDTVTWTNKDEAPHTVTSDTAGAFESGTLTSGGTFVQTFATAGTFTYHCAIHPSMKASLVVQAASSAPPAGGATPGAPSSGDSLTSSPGGDQSRWLAATAAAVVVAGAGTAAMWVRRRS